MKTITVPREIKFSEEIPGMTAIEVALFEACKSQIEMIDALTNIASDEGFEDQLDIADITWKVNIAMDHFTNTLIKLKLEDEECPPDPKH